MIIVISLAAAIFAIFAFNTISNYNKYLAFEIEESNNISYDIDDVKDVTPLEIINNIEKAEREDNPILIYFYTSWCRVCKKQLPIINEIARKFQNTDLEVIFVAIDKNITQQKTIDGLQSIKDIYFQPKYLSDRNGFKDLLKTKSIKFRNRIPFSVIIGRNSQIITQFSGYKNFKYFDNRIMKALFREDEDI